MYDRPAANIIIITQLYQPLIVSIYLYLLGYIAVVIIISCYYMHYYYRLVLLYACGSTDHISIFQQLFRYNIIIDILLLPISHIIQMTSLDYT